ncbi:MAG: YbaB/EbfC family nucleoid-associated protein [Saprospiraceae bacterium]|nr:YbaB/EbfC family nucleoid-associated protein [Saprospiraceae bacterium]
MRHRFNHDNSIQMLDGLLGNMNEKQAEMKKRLADEIVEASIEDGAIIVKANANREIVDFTIDASKTDLTDLEKLQDLLVIATNEVLTIAAEREAAEAQKMISDMIPPGLGGLFGMK